MSLMFCTTFLILQKRQDSFIPQRLCACIDVVVHLKPVTYKSISHFVSPLQRIIDLL